MNARFQEPVVGSTVALAFDWLCHELELPSEASRQVLRQAFIDLHGQGSRNAASKLIGLWPDGARWPNGQAWLASGKSKWNDTLEDLMFLLHVRHTRVAHRLYTDAQVRNFIHPESPHRLPGTVYAIINKINFDDDNAETNICGIPYAHVVSVQEGLAFMKQPAHEHPECHCSISALTERDFLRKYVK